MSPMRIAVLMTCHNRRELTLRCLRALHAALPARDRAWVQVILVDDGSTDGTSAAVRREFPGVELLSGDGSLFWAGGMRKAFGHALGRGYDHYLWLNDDTLLHPGAVDGLLDAYGQVAGAGEGAVVVGSTCDASTGRLSYGGSLRASRWRPMRFQLIAPGALPLPCDVFNGNCVLISSAAAQAVGNIDPVYVHGMGDFDYGLRARAAGIRCWIAPGVVGTCSNNAAKGTAADRDLPLVARWGKMMGPKGVPPRPWARLTQRACGSLWPLVWAWPYVKLVLTSRRIFPRQGRA